MRFSPAQRTVALALTLTTLSVSASVARAAERPNVLFILVDDLRPELACYGRSHVRSPSIDRLANEGVLFERAYCMVPTCGASRASMMTGRRPANNRFVSYMTRADHDAPDATTLNTHFLKNGYETVSLGKVFHHGVDNRHGWTGDKVWRPRTGGMGYQLPANRELHRRGTKKAKNDRPNRGPPFESADVADEAYADGQIAAHAVSELGRLARGDKPFFLAVGFYKPHLPFNAPKRYWDLYDRKTIRLPSNYGRPQGVPDAALHTSGELRAYAGVPRRGPVSDEMAHELIHGYYACVSFVDAQIGKVLAAVDRLELRRNTIVVLWADHGWNLGEHGLWCKHCCYETSMRIPLIVRAPGIEGGKRTHGLTESIDLYPTLCELAGLSQPDHLQGRSFAPLLREPGREWKDAAIGRFGRGDTIRTQHHRFSLYTRPSGEVLGRMLYDHRVDSDEDANLSEREKNAALVRELTKMLRAGMGKPNATRPAKAKAKAKKVGPKR